MTTGRGETDEALLDACRAGDRAALDRLLERYEPRIYRFGLRMCRDREAARDVLQETLIAAARTVRDFRGTSSLSTWLYTIARSFCIKQRRRSKFAPFREESLDDASVSRNLEATTPSPETASAEAEVSRALSRAISELEPMYREVLLLRDGEGLTAPEVAEVLGISIDAVKSRLHRARASVRAILAPKLGIVEVPREAACPDVVELFSRHLEGDITSAICVVMEQHLASCRACRSRCDSLREVLGRCRTATDTVPEAVQRDVRRALEESLTRPP